MGSQNLQIANNDLEILQCSLYSSKDFQEDILLPPHLSQSASQQLVTDLQHIHLPFLFTYPSLPITSLYTYFETHMHMAATYDDKPLYLFNVTLPLLGCFLS